MENRVIKFRAWDSIQNMMVNEIQSCYDGVFDKNINHPQYGSVSCFEEFLRPFDEEQKKFHEYHVMEFTGMNDSKGKEIYECDILKVPQSFAHNCHDNELCVCKYGAIENGARFYMLSLDKSLGFDVIYEIKFNEFEVIGNIYENPELMDKNSRKN